MTQQNPKDWKTYDQFAYGIDTNRLPLTQALDGSSHTIHFDDGRTLSLAFSGQSVEWSDGGQSGKDAVEVVTVAPDTYFIEIAYSSKPLEAETVILNTATRRALSILSIVRPKEETVGEPQVGQIFRPGVLAGGVASGFVPAESRDLIGLRAHFTYSPNHVYEHIYLSSQRYAWQNLVGVQRGHGDVDLATTWKFDQNQYVFGFREFIIPVASLFFYNWDVMQSTGKFLGVTSQGRIENKPAGAFIEKKTRTVYDMGKAPV